MSTSNTYRPIPLALTLLIATFSALVALAVSGGRDAHAHGTTSTAIHNEAETTARHNRHLQALHMADMLSAGIVKQFPKRFL